MKAWLDIGWKIEKWIATKFGSSVYFLWRGKAASQSEPEHFSVGAYLRVNVINMSWCDRKVSLLTLSVPSSNWLALSSCAELYGKWLFWNRSLCRHSFPCLTINFTVLSDHMQTHKSCIPWSYSWNQVARAEMLKRHGLKNSLSKRLQTWFAYVVVDLVLEMGSEL